MPNPRRYSSPSTTEDKTLNEVADFYHVQYNDTDNKYTFSVSVPNSNTGLDTNIHLGELYDAKNYTATDEHYITFNNHYLELKKNNDEKYILLYDIDQQSGSFIEPPIEIDNVITMKKTPISSSIHGGRKTKKNKKNKRRSRSCRRKTRSKK
jgi:hypothetical protein